MKKKGIFVLAAIAIVAIVYAVVLYPWPVSNQDALGTIGGVKKYNANQISDKDVQLSEQALTNGEIADPAVVLAFYRSASTPGKEATVEKDASSLPKDASVMQKDASSLQKDASVMQKDASSLQKDASVMPKDASGMQKDAGGLQKTADELQKAIMYWNSASIQAKEQFYRTWLEKTEGLNKTENSDLQKTSGDQ